MIARDTNTSALRATTAVLLDESQLTSTADGPPGQIVAVVISSERMPSAVWRGRTKPEFVDSHL